MTEFFRVNEAVDKVFTFLQSPAQHNKHAKKGRANEADNTSYIRNGSNDDSNEEDIVELFNAPRSSTCHAIDLEITFLSAPYTHRVPLYVKVPHPFMTGSICIITLPPQRSYKDKIMHLAEEGHALAKQVKRVIDSTKLRAKVSEPVAVRAFAKSYDNFILYGLRKYPVQLTGEFIGHHKLPVWIAKKGTVQSALETAARTVVVPRRGQNAITCRIGNTNMKQKDIVDNINAFLRKFISHPQGAPLEHILHIRVASSHRNGRRVGLPIYGHKFIFPDSTSVPSTVATTTIITSEDNNNTNEEMLNISATTVANAEDKAAEESHA